jgi:predicted MFS family arabinose efflux permease
VAWSRAAAAVSGPAPPDTPSKEGTRWAAVWSLMAAGFVGAAQVGKGAAALPVLQAEFGLNASAAAWYLSAMSLLGAVGGALLGWLGQALGFRRQVLLGLGTIALANLLGAALQTAPALLATRVGEGFGFILVVLAAPGLLPGLAGPTRRRLVVGAWGTYMPVGSGLAALLVPPAVAAVGWPGTWLLDALLAVLAALAIARWVPGEHAHRLPDVEGLLTAVRSPGVLCLAAVFALYAGQYLAVLGLFPAMLVHGGGIPLRTAGVLSGLAFLVNAPGNLVGAYLQHRGAARWALVVAGSLCMATTVWVAQAAGLPLAVRIAAVALFSFTAGLVPATLFNGVAAMTAGTSAAGSSVGVLMQGSSVGQLLVPPLVVAAGAASSSWPAPWTAQPATLSALALLAVLGGVLYRRWDVARGPGGPAREAPAAAPQGSAPAAGRTPVDRDDAVTHDTGRLS